MKSIENFPYLAIKVQFSESPEPILLVAKERIERLAISDTYGSHGQAVSTYDAGDSVELDTQKAVDIANRVCKEEVCDNAYEWEAGDYISAYDHSDCYDEVVSALEKEAVEGEDYTLYQETLDGFNYWDGHNYQTVSISVENGEASHEVIDDKDFLAELIEEFKSKEWDSEGFGTQKYTTPNGWEVVGNYCQGVFASWEVYEPETVELLTENTAY